MKIRKLIYAVAGCLFLGLGAVGAVLPVLPSVPFLLLAAFCFAKSSRRLHDWFVGTRLYRRHLEGFCSGRGMTPGTKIRILCALTLLMGIGFVLMLHRGIVIGCILLSVIWLGHVLLILLRVRTIRPAAYRQPTGEASCDTSQAGS